MSKKSMVIRDDILGDITVPPDLTELVSHSLFQRLRGIGQTGLLYLIYPGMKHTRFEHSIGTMHLSLEWYKSISSVFKTEDVRKKFYPITKDLDATDGSKILIKETEKLWNEITNDVNWKNILSAAALLHDVGHGPFSHSIESYGLLSLEDCEDFVSNDKIQSFLKCRHQDHKTELERKSKKKNKKKLVSHEDFSLAVAFKILSESKIFPDDIKMRLYVCCLINKDFKAHLFKIDGFISNDDQHKLRLLTPLISGLFDVDRMDYMRRDSTKAGVKYGISEVQRLMSCLIPTLVTDNQNNSPDVNLITRARNIHSVDHFLVGLFQLYTALYMHPSYEGYQHELGLAVEMLKNTNSLWSAVVFL